MAFTTGDFNMHPEVFKECDEVIDEKSNTFIALRLVQWCKNGSEPDKNLAKLELRKWRVKDGEEHADKGCSFLTPEGPGELTKALIKHGYGDTSDLLHQLSHRDDFKDAVEHFNDTEEDKERLEEPSGEVFDMRNFLLSDDNQKDNDDIDEDEEM